VRTRNSEGIRLEQRIKDIYPYCFVKDEDSSLVTEALHRERGFTGLYGESLTKLVFSDPSQISKLKHRYPDLQTWEANIPFVNRVLVDSGFKPQEYDSRIWFLDGEWKVGSGEITILTAKDSYTGNLYVWFTHSDYPPGRYTEIPCKAHPEGLENVTLDIPAIAFANERDMLDSFAKHLAKHDPDIITGWNVVNADIQQICRRMKENDLNPGALSPFRRIRYEFRDWAQPIPGRLCIDLMLAFTRLWILKNGQLPSKSLDDVAKECLGEGKVKLADGHDTYYTDFGTYLDYNIRDVTLLPRLNALNNAIEHHLAIQRVVGCDIRSTPFITNLFSVLALRDEDFTLRIPTKPQFDKVDYEGADIMSVEASVYDRIAILDIKAMYHANIDMHNISWENICEDGVDCGNGTHFIKESEGLLGRQMGLLTGLRNEYKRAMKGSATEAEYRRWDSLQYATKSMVASMYGVAGDARYGMYHPQIAAAVTYTSRQTLRRLREKCEARGYPVKYGHTDSVMVQIPSPDETLALNEILNEELAPIEVEFERWCERFLITTKNRYAASVVWADGKYRDKDIYFKGIELKQSRMPKAMKNTMQKVIEGILNGEKEEDITGDIANLVADIVAGEIPLGDLVLKGELKRDLAKYSTISEARAGAVWANDRLGKGYRSGSFFQVTLDDNGEYIAFDEPSDIEGIATVGFRHIAQRFIVNKIEQYYALAGWDFQPILNALHGKAVVEWI